jgi:signal transduction histidine kinase
MRGQGYARQMSLALPARLSKRSPRLTDAAVALVVALPVIGSLLARAIARHEPLVLLIGPAALAAIFLRRRWPLPALVLATAAAAALPDIQPLLLPPLVVLYTIASTQARSEAVAAGVGVALVTLLATIGWGNGDLTNHAIGDSAQCAAAVALGLYVAARRRVMDGVRDRAERLDRERELLTEQAVIQERVRIAQELHDVVAHSVSLMVVEAQALGATVDDDRVEKTTLVIADLGREAMAEMHRTLRLLRAGESEAAQLAPQPGLGNLDTLLDQSRSAGLDVQLTVEGQPRPLSQAADLSAFRIVQEALTNVIKHAGGARTMVTLRYGADDLELTVIDNGDATPPAKLRRSSDGHGHGVIGMRERAALFGGTLTAEPRLDHGFKVTAMLPYIESGA